MKKVILYTDGACSGNPGPGGWGAVLIAENGITKEISGYQDDTTNNRMELTAVIKGLECLKEPCIVEVHSDSAYLVNCFNNNWIETWQKNNWKNNKKENIKNVDLWQSLLNLLSIHTVSWQKVTGHSTDKYNNRCDHLATSAIKELVKLKNGAF